MKSGTAAVPSIVAFDFGGVVIEWNMRLLFNEFFDSEAELDAFLATVLTPAENRRVDSGESLSETVARLTAEHPEHRAPLAAWRDRWIETIGEEIPGTEELIDDLLAAGYRVVGLSNFSTETFPMCQAKFPVFEKFETIVLSGALGVTKPDPAIYHALCEQVGATPEQIVFTDDAQANVDGAQHVGMHAFFFVDSTQARNELRALGISV